MASYAVSKKHVKYTANISNAAGINLFPRVLKTVRRSFRAVDRSGVVENVASFWDGEEGALTRGPG